MFNKKGVTLITLVVTIIVLLLLTGLAPKLWLRESTIPDINGLGCFYNCKSLSNYDDIPYLWKIGGDPR